MFILTVSILLLVIHQGECTIKARAHLYPDNSSELHGLVTFTQDNADTPVRVTGSITYLNASSAHVCSTKKVKEEIFVLFFCFRVFMFMYILYQKLHLIVQLLALILILTVIREILNLNTKFVFFRYPSWSSYS